MINNISFSPFWLTLNHPFRFFYFSIWKKKIKSSLTFSMGGSTGQEPEVTISLSKVSSKSLPDSRSRTLSFLFARSTSVTSCLIRVSTPSSANFSGEYRLYSELLEKLLYNKEKQYGFNTAEAIDNNKLNNEQSSGIALRINEIKQYIALIQKTERIMRWFYEFNNSRRDFQSFKKGNAGGAGTGLG